jgi:hypothetical protein
VKAILLAAAFIALGQAQTPEQPGGISGRVTSSAGQPLDKAVLHLERSVTAEEIEKIGGPIPSFKAETDGLGSFLFEGLKPERYDLVTAPLIGRAAIEAEAAQLE